MKRIFYHTRTGELWGYVYLILSIVLVYVVSTFCQDSLPLVSSNQTEMFFNPGDLLPNTTYYWKIVARDSTGAETSGETWSFTTEDVVPVELVSFTGKIKKDKAILEWETATEVSNYGFIIEQSTGGTFKKIGFVEGHGNSNSNKFYSFEVRLPFTAKYFFRLKQVDTDGTFDYSDVVELSYTTGFVMRQNYPNPFNSSTIIEYQINKFGVVKYEVFNIAGKVLYVKQETKQPGGHKWIYKTELPSGHYFYRISLDGIVLGTKSFVILK